MDMIVADLERANGRVAAVERRNVSFISGYRIDLPLMNLFRKSFAQRLKQSEAEAMQPTGVFRFSLILDD